MTTASARRRVVRHGPRRAALAVRAWYAGLSIRHKIAILPSVAAAGFGAVFALALGLGIATQHHLGALERDRYPALETSRRLRDVLEGTQGALLTAVVASDTDRFAAADSLARSFTTMLDAGTADSALLVPGRSAARLALRRAHAAYYTSARRASAALATHETGDAAHAAIQAMVVRYNALRAALAVRIAHESRDVDAEFRTTRAFQTAMWIGVVGTAVLALAALAAVALMATRGMVRPLGAAIAVARQLAAGPRESAAGSDVTFPIAGRDEVGQLLRALRTMVASLRSAESAVRDREARFHALVAQSSDVILVLGPDTAVQYVSDSVASIYGLTPATLVGRAARDLVHRDDVGAVQAALARVLASPGDSARVSYRVLDAAGAWRQVEAVIVNRLGDPVIAGIVLNTRDVTERAALEAQLVHQAFHDALTGLANRFRFRDRAAQALACTPDDARGTGASGVAVLLIDLDGFKLVNDTAGHAAGDALLREVADRLLNATRGCDLVARLGGDEFAVLLANVGGDADVAAVAGRILGALASPFAVQGTTVIVGASIGIARGGCAAVAGQPALALTPVTAEAMRGEVPSEILGESPIEDVLRNADLALYEAEARGRGQYVTFEAGMHAAVSERLALESALRRGLECGEFHLAYQPIVDLASGTLSGVEALVRWQHPERGLVSPAAFIPLAEETGLIRPLGRWVLEEACRQGAAWAAHGYPAFSVTVNVSGRQLQQAAFVGEVEAALDGSGFPAQRLVLELTESTVIDHPEVARQRLTALKALGVRLAIDDFGTGYSALSYLRQFPIDVLKIDKSFVDPITAGPRPVALAAAIVAIGDALGLRTIAEGIESAEQAAALDAMGCALGQGYYFSRPLTADAFGAWLDARRGDRSGADPGVRRVRVPGARRHAAAV